MEREKDNNLYVEIETELVKNVYDNIAHHFNYTRAYKWKWINEFIECYDNTNILYDIGCGSGRNIIPPLNKADKFPKCIGIDNCNNFINICREKKLEVYKCDMLSLPFKNNSADAIISIASFHHLSTLERRIGTLLEMKRVLKKSNKNNNIGRILLSVWSINQPENTRRKFRYGDIIVPWNNHDEIFNRYYYIFKISELYQLFEKVGLNIEKHFWDYGNEIFILTK